MFLHTLDNTSWSIADIIGPIGTGTHIFSVNFTSDDTDYTAIRFVGDANSGSVYYDDTLVATYPNTTWEEAAYQNVTIAGGIDATNPTLLAWFKQYAKNATPSGGDVDIIGALNDIAEAISGGGSGGGLPDATSASAGDVLSLDEDKKPTWSTPSGGVMRIEADMQTMTLGKTWQEISDCFANGGYAYVAIGLAPNVTVFEPVVAVAHLDTTYSVSAISPESPETMQTINFSCSSPDEYPVLSR